MVFNIKKDLFLVIGCGSIGRRHIGNLKAAGVRNVLAFDVRDDRRRDAERSFGVRVSGNLEDAFEAAPRVCFITTPTALHLPLATAAARQGTDLFIEKPLSHNHKGVEEFLQIVRRKRLTTLVGCNMRFHPALALIKAFLDKRVVGRVLSARVEVGQYLPDWHPREDYRRGYSARRAAGGGIILDAVHELDYIRWMLGPVESVSCFAGKLSRLEIETEDNAAILLKFCSGAIGEVHLDYVQRAYSRSCHIIGEEGTIRWDWNSGEVRLYRAADKKWKSYPIPARWEVNRMYSDELRHFLRCLKGKEKPALDVFEAAKVLNVALAAKESAATGRVVRLRGN